MIIRTGWAYPFLILIVLVGSIALRLSDPFALQALRAIAFDTYQRIEPAGYREDTPVRIVAIDAVSLERIGPWPWPADVMTLLLERLAAQGAPVVAFDMVFPEGAPGEDGAFAAAVAASKAALPVILTDQPTDGPVSEAKAAFAVMGEDPRPFMPAFANAVANRPALDAAAAGIGAIDRSTEAVAAVRRLPLVARVGEDVLPWFAIEVLRVAEGADTYTLTVDGADGWMAALRPPGITRLAVGDITVPTDPDGGMRLVWRTANPDAHVPAWQVLAGENEVDVLSGRIVLVGLTAPGLADVRATALEPAVAHVELQAMAIEHILSGRTLIRPGEALAIEVAVVVVVGLLLAFFIPRLGLITAVVVSLVAVGFILVGGWLAFRDLGLVLDPTWPALTVWVLAASGAVTLHRRLERQRAEIRLAFGHSLAPPVVNAILADPGQIVLTGEKRELTVLFCKVVTFAEIAARLDAKALIAFVNRLYVRLSDAILGERGTIAGNRGDAVTAFWNAPLDHQDHAAAACRAAAGVVGGVAAFNSQRREDADRLPEERRTVVGIGIATGDCSVGNLGSGERFDYSAIGEPVAQAVRLQGLSTFYGVPTVIDEATVERLTDVAVIEVDLVRVQGRARSVRLFTLLAAIDGGSVSDRLAEPHARMIASYRDRDWRDAEAALGECFAFRIEGLATLYSLYRSRIAAFRAIPPPDGWDGADMATLR